MPRLASLICILSIAVVAGASEYDRRAAVEISQSVIGEILGEHVLRDTDGQSFTLSQLYGKPLIVSMIYTSCHHVCPLITKNLASTIEIARDALGEEAFSVVTVGFDWREDTPDRMRQYAKQQGANLPGWHFLAADSETVANLSEALGFQFYPGPQGFDHLAQTTVVGSDSTIYRQVYGVDIDTQSLVEPLKELVYGTPRSAGFIEHWISTLKLFCTVYDPNSDRYRFDYSILMTLFVGILSLGALAVFIVREWKRAK